MSSGAKEQIEGMEKAAENVSKLSARSSQDAIQFVADLILSGKAKNIVVLTGAGISTSAGIPDFRSPTTGLYANLQQLNLPFPEAVFELGFFKRNPKPFWTLAKELYPGKFMPTSTHHLLNLLSTHHLLLRLFTQNIDTLEHLTGLDPTKIVEAHGSFASSHCLTCGKEASREYVLSAGVRQGEVVRCAAERRGSSNSNSNLSSTGNLLGANEKSKSKCGGLIKPDIVFFGEGLPDRFFKSLGDLRRADLLLVLGTSLQVHPFASLVNYVGEDVPRVLINREAVGPFVNARTRSERRVSGREHRDHKPEGQKDEDSDGSEGDSEDDSDDGIGREGNDWFYPGDCDEATWALADALGWRKELEEAIEKGKERMEKEWGEVEASLGVAGADKTGSDGATASVSGVERAVADSPGKGPDEKKTGAQAADEGGEGGVDEEEDLEDLQKAIQNALNLR